MSQISYDQVMLNKQANSGNRIPFFSLKNDNDEAIVRIMHNSVQDFEILEVHSLPVNGKYLKINCIRDAKEPLDACPLCANGQKLIQRLFVHLIQYTIENGTVVATPKVWERPVSYVTELKSKLDMYGPLSEQLFVIKRHGAAGDMKTTYSMDYAPPQVYSYDQYQKLSDAFTGYTAIGNAVIEKTKEELQHFISCGSFPNSNNVNSAQPAQDNFTPSTNIPAVGATPTYVQPINTQQPSVVPAIGISTGTPPWEQGNPYMNTTGQPPVQQAVQRPVRYY